MPKAPLHHVSLEVGDVDRARWFYDHFLLPLGYRRFVADADYVGYTDGAMTLWFLKGRGGRIRRKPPSPDDEVIAEHLAFKLTSSGAVRAREAALRERKIYPFFEPEEHPEFTPGYFSASWVDPDGIVLELYAIERPSARRRAPSKSRRRPARRARARRSTSGRRR